MQWTHILLFLHCFLHTMTQFTVCLKIGKNKLSVLNIQRKKKKKVWTLCKGKKKKSEHYARKKKKVWTLCSLPFIICLSLKKETIIENATSMDEMSLPHPQSFWKWQIHGDHHFYNFEVGSWNQSFKVSISFDSQLKPGQNTPKIKRNRF